MIKLMYLKLHATVTQLSFVLLVMVFPFIITLFLYNLPYPCVIIAIELYSAAACGGVYFQLTLYNILSANAFLFIHTFYLFTNLSLPIHVWIRNMI